MVMNVRGYVRKVGYVALGALLFGCGNSDDKGEVAGEKLELAFIPKAGTNLVFDMGNDGAQFGARYVGHEEGVDIEVEYLAPATLDPKLQRDLIRQAIDSKKDGLLVSCIDDSISDPIDEAVEAGIPVIT
jgi:ABC-type sugar transport system substrate-binding protein